jgi:hypothetical protein
MIDTSCASNLVDFLSDDKFPPSLSQATLLADTTIRDKLWSKVNIDDIETCIKSSYDSTSPFFHAKIAHVEMESAVLQLLLVGSQNSFKRSVTACQRCADYVHSISKEFNKVSQAEYEGFRYFESFVFGLDCMFVEAETLFTSATLDVYQKNYMTASHCLLKCWKKYQIIRGKLESLKDIAQTFKDVSSTSASSEAQEQNAIIDKEDDPLESLARQIETKTKEIRDMNIDRRGVIPEEVIEATRDLLQLKQMYKELKGTWKSSDGHADVRINQKRKENNNSLSTYADTSRTSPQKTANTSSEPKPRFFDANNENSNSPVLIRNVLNAEIENAEKYKRKNQKLKNVDNDLHHQLRSASIGSASDCNLANSSSAPASLKMTSSSVPVVRVVIPGIPDIYNYFFSAPAVKSPKKRNMQKSSRTESAKSATGDASPNKQESNRKGVFAESDGSAIPVNFEAAIHVIAAKAKTENERVAKYNRMLIQFESRLHFALALFDLLGSIVAPELSWILAIIDCPSNAALGIAKLYQVHRFKECRWSSLASLLLLNLPKRFAIYGCIFVFVLFNLFHHLYMIDGSILESALVSKSWRKLCQNGMMPSSDCSSITHFLTLVESQCVQRLSRCPFLHWSLACHSGRAVQEGCAGLSFRIDHTLRALRDCGCDLVGGSQIVMTTPQSSHLSDSAATTGGYSDMAASDENIPFPLLFLAAKLYLLSADWQKTCVFR